jgi:sulfate/thiosulfate transport system permease protein
VSDAAQAPLRQYRSRYRGTKAQRALVAAALGYLSLLLVVPLCALLWAALGGPAARLFDTLTARPALEALGLSLAVALAATVINGLFGVAAALVLVRQQFTGRRVFDTLIDLPLAMSPVMIGLGLLLVYGAQGLLPGAGVAFARPAVLLATLFVTLPFAVRQVGHVLAQSGTTEEQAAATLGASPWQRFWYVTLPNMKYGLIFGATLTAARALGEFGAVLVVGGAIAGRTRTATTYIYTAFEERREADAFAVALVLSGASIALLLLLKAAGRRLRARS